MMQQLLIAHRGNLTGPNPAEENKPEYIQKALDDHYSVEVDLWYSIDGKLYLGHDRPQYKVPSHWLFERRDRLWIHCKNSEALVFMTRDPSLGFNYFYHKSDPYTLTSRGYVWCYPTTVIAPERSICVLPETVCGWEQIPQHSKDFYGICSDFVSGLDTDYNDYDNFKYW